MKTDTIRMIAEAMSLTDNPQIIDLLRQAVQNEEAPETHKETGPDIYSWTEQDKKNQSIFRGVIHQEGWQYASDRHYLVGIRKDYSPEYEGCSVTAKGEILEGNPPKCKTVIPAFDGHDTVTVPVDKLRVKALKEAAKEAKEKIKAQMQEAGIKKAKTIIPVLFGNAYFMYESLMKVLDFCLKTGIPEMKVRVKDDYGKAFISTPDKTAIVMGIRTPDDPDNEYTTVKY